MIVHWLIAQFVPKQFMSSLIPLKTLIAEALQSAVIHFIAIKVICKQSIERGFYWSLKT